MSAVESAAQAEEVAAIAADPAPLAEHLAPAASALVATATAPAWVDFWLRPDRFFARLRPLRRRSIACIWLLLAFSRDLDWLAGLGPIGTWRGARWAVMSVLPAATWFVGGALYRLRLRFCGVPSPDPVLARAVAGLTGALTSAGAILSTVLSLWRTRLGHDQGYAWYWLACNGWDLLLGYFGAVYGFGANRKQALVWFGILPGLLRGLLLWLSET